MIHGFEELTHELKKNELDLIDDFISFFKKRKGSNKATTNKKVSLYFNKKYKINLTEVRVRKIINFLRINKLVRNLIASSKGYYIEEDPEKILNYKKSLMQRGKEIIRVANTFEAVIQEKINFDI